MENIAQSFDETKADTMREENNEGYIALVLNDAEDVLHVVLEMKMEQRKRVLPDLEEMADFIARAIKECQ